MPAKNPPILSDTEVLRQFEAPADRKGQVTEVAPTAIRSLFSAASARLEFPRPNLGSSPASLSNVWQGRRGAIKSIVCHTMSGSYEGTISWFANPASQASTNISIAQDGRATVHVDPLGSNAPFANGYTCNPDAEARAVMASVGGANLNYHTISIEHEDKRVPNWQITNAPSQFTASTLVSAWLCSIFDLDPKAPGSFLGHYQIDSCGRSGCPGWNASTWNSYMTEVSRLLSSSGTPEPPVVVTPAPQLTDPMGDSWLAALADIVVRNGVYNFVDPKTGNKREYRGQEALVYLVENGVSLMQAIQNLNTELLKVKSFINYTEK